jgi:SAM-dependent methyltransferase
MDLMYSSDQDKVFYQNCTNGLPTLAGMDGTGRDKFGIPLPYGTGPHSVRCLREIVEIVKPKSIFEIGLNMGWSSAMWLELSDAEVVSCDISYKDETVNAAKFLEDKYSRFQYVNRLEKENFGNAVNKKFDLVFIDGGHEFDDVVSDLKLCVELNIPFFAMDDWLPQYGQVQDAVKSFGNKLEVVNVNGNISLLKNNLYDQSLR